MNKLLRGLTVFFLALAFLWALAVFGATRTADLYRVSLILMVPAILILSGSFSVGRGGTGSWIVLSVSGIVLFLGVSLHGTLEARGFLLLALGWMSFLCTFSIAQTRGGRIYLFLALILIGIIEALIGISQALTGMAAGSMKAVSGTLFNQNHYAGLQNMFMGLSLGALVALYESESVRSPRATERWAAAWIGILACSTIGLSVFLSRSRAGAVGLLLTLALATLLLRFGTRRSRSSRRRIWSVSLLVGAVTLALGSILGLGVLLERFQSSESHLQQRAHIYTDTLQLIVDQPFGIGPDMFQWRFRPYQSLEGRVWYDYAHNDYLQTAAEWGVPLALLFWALVVWVFLLGIRAGWRAKDPWRRGIGLGGGLAILGILLHSLVDFNLYIPSNWMVFSSILALTFTAAKGSRT